MEKKTLISIIMALPYLGLGLLIATTMVFWAGLISIIPMFNVSNEALRIHFEQWQLIVVILGISGFVTATIFGLALLLCWVYGRDVIK